MSRIEWDKTGERVYETGVKNGVLYTPNAQGAYTNGVAWNGLTGVTEKPSGAETQALWADDIKYAAPRSKEEFGGTIEAYTYPDEFAECDGTKELADGVTIGQQKRKTFGLCYRTIIGNDTENDDYGYKLHIVYGATASPAERGYKTVNDSPEAITFSWEFETTPVEVTGCEATAILTIDSTKADATKLEALKDILYGTENDNPRLPLPDEIKRIFTTTTNNGNNPTP